MKKIELKECRFCKYFYINHEGYELNLCSLKNNYNTNEFDEDCPKFELDEKIKQALASQSD